MNDSITLDSNDYAILSTLDVGKRVKYIRELLQKRYGNQYSGKSLASRVGISQSNFVHLEQKANDVPSKVLRAISRDFNVPMDVFFDDFYQGDYKPVIIEKQSTEEDFELDSGKSDYVSADETSDVNPIDEDSYTFVVIAYLEASNGDRRVIFNNRSKEPYKRTHVRHVISNLINSMDEMDIFINPIHLPNDKKPSSTFQALQHIETRDNPELYIWIPKKLIHDTTMFLERVGRKYTDKLNEQISTKNNEQ